VVKRGVPSKVSGVDPTTVNDQQLDTSNEIWKKEVDPSY
jgi:hypothetical protein